MKFSKCQNTSAGQSLVETALFFTILLILLGGAIDLGGAFFAFINIRDAAEDGALFASYQPNQTEIIDHIRNSAINPPGPFSRQVVMTDLTSSDISIVFTPNRAGGPCAGDTVTISITYNYPVKLPMMSAIVGQNITLRSVATNSVMTPVCYN